MGSENPYLHQKSRQNQNQLRRNHPVHDPMVPPPKQPHTTTKTGTPMKYISREFYSVFGKFDVTIKIDKEIKEYGYNSSKIIDGKTKWRFKAENILTSAWTADPNFTAEQNTIPNRLSIYYIYRKTKKPSLESLQALYQKILRRNSVRIRLIPLSNIQLHTSQRRRRGIRHVWRLFYSKEKTERTKISTDT